MTLKRYEIINNPERTVELLAVERFDIHYEDEVDVDEILNDMKECFSLDMLDNEHIYVVSANYYGVPTGIILVSVGDHKQSMVYTRTIGIFLLLIGAKKFLMLHNHPDNEISSSNNDLISAADVQNLANIIGIDFLGSYVVGRDGWCKVGEDELCEWRDYT